MSLLHFTIFFILHIPQSIMSADIAKSHLYSSYPIPGGSRCTRVIHVRPAAAGASYMQPIACDICVIDLDKNPSFAALSYEWGPEPTGEFKPEVICEDVPLRVTENGYSALWHLRAKLGGFCIWIDAICIDQGNQKEKEQQIPLMKDIYSKAETVYIWLGPGNSATERAVRYLGNGGLMRYFTGESGDIEEHFQRPRMSRMLLAYFRSRWSSTDTLVPEDLDDYHRSWFMFSPLRRWRVARKKYLVSFSDISELLGSRWATRIWTYQEIIMASRPVLISGHCHLPWENFSLAAIFLSSFTEIASLGRWIEMITTRVHYRNHFSSGQRLRRTDEVDTLLDYLEFAYELNQVIFSIFFGLLLLGYFILIPLVILTLIIAGRIEGQRITVSVAVAAGCLGALLLAIIMYAAVLSWLPPNPPLPGHRDRDQSGFDALLKAPIQRGVLNTICWREAKEAKDMSFGILSMLGTIYSATLPKVEYSEDLSQVYTNLAAFLFQSPENADMLWLAAEARCPGAPTWVPDFSQVFAPLSGPVVVQRRKRTIDVAQILGHAESAMEEVPLLRRSITVQVKFIAAIVTVSDFLDTGSVDPDMQLATEKHNAKRMINQAAIPGHGDSPFWVRAFRQQFPKVAKMCTEGGLRKYELAVMEAVTSNLSPEMFLYGLKNDENGIVDIHDTICATFARSDRLYFATDAVPTVEFSYMHPQHGQEFDYFEELSERLMWVSGQQQGQIRDGDEIVLVQGMTRHVIVRRSENALIAQLEPISLFFRGPSELKRNREDPTSLDITLE